MNDKEYIQSLEERVKNLETILNSILSIIFGKVVSELQYIVFLTMTVCLEVIKAVTEETVKEVEKMNTFESVCKQIKLTCIEYRKAYGECPKFCPMRRDESFKSDKVDPTKSFIFMSGETKEIINPSLLDHFDHVYTCRARWPFAWNLEVDDE